MIASAKVKNGRVIHQAIDMGGFLYISCHADPTTMKTEKVEGEVTCKKCLGLKNAVVPNYQFAEGIHALKHPFCRKDYENDGFGAGWHDGRDNLKTYLPDGSGGEFIRGYEEGYYEGQQNYTYHYKNGNTKAKPLTNVPVKTFGNSNQSSNKATQQINAASGKKKPNITLGKLIFWTVVISFISFLLNNK